MHAGSDIILYELSFQHLSLNYIPSFKDNKHSNLIKITQKTAPPTRKKSVWSITFDSFFTFIFSCFLSFPYKE